jgi:hypothetical protein
MKLFSSLLTALVLGMFGLAMAGCSAEAEVGDNDRDVRVRETRRYDNDTSYKKTTVVEPDGDRRTTIERKDY